MRINGHRLPEDLKADIRGGGLKLDEARLQRFRLMLKGVNFEPRCPYFIGPDNIERDNGIWSWPLENLRGFIGRRSFWRPPGDVDPRRVVNIGVLATDQALALDYRTTPPRVVYQIDNGDWRTIATSYAALKRKLRLI